MPRKIKVREILLYSEKVTEDDVRNFYNTLMKSRLPMFGFIDFSDIISFKAIRMVVRRKLNTARFFVRERGSLSELGLLVFPYKISDPIEIDTLRGSVFPLPKFYLLTSNQDFLNFSLKERIEELNVNVIKILGKFLGFGTAISENGRKSFIFSLNPSKLMRVNLEKNPAVYVEVLDPIPKRMSVHSDYPVFEETGISVGVDNFDVFQHSLFIGASGTGKTRALFAMIRAIEAKHGNNVRIVILDPHGEFSRIFTKDKIVDLIHNYIEPLDVGGMKTPLMTQLVAQLLASAIGQENKYSERVLFYAVHLLSSVDKMDLRNVSLLLTDSSKRAEFVSQTENDEVKRFFDEEFNDIYIHHFNDAVLPILNFVGEYELYLGGDKKREHLADLIKKNRVTVVSFNPNFFGKRMINFLSGAIINQMYILAITEKLNTPTILVTDEFQRVETRVVRDMLAETRKFNLYMYLSMQYLGQISKEVHDSIISNIRNIVAFKLNRQDATMISSIMEIKVEEYFKKARSQMEIEESKKEMFVRLHQRECIVRLFDGKKYLLPMRLRVVDVKNWGFVETGPSAQENAEQYAEEAAEAESDKRDIAREKAEQETENSVRPAPMPEPEKPVIHEQAPRRPTIHDPEPKRARPAWQEESPRAAHVPASSIMEEKKPAGKREAASAKPEPAEPATEDWRSLKDWSDQQKKRKQEEPAQERHAKKAEKEEEDDLNDEESSEEMFRKLKEKWKKERGN